MMRRSQRLFVGALLMVACSGSTRQPQVPGGSRVDGAVAATHTTAASKDGVAPDVPTGAAAKRAAELSAKAAAFVDAFTNWEPELTRDGKRVVFLSNRDGLPQLYLADARDPAEAATRIVTTTERIERPFATLDGKHVMFMSDTGADEQWSVFRVGLDGQNLVELTPGPELQRDPFIIPDGRPSTFFFSARKLAEPTSTVYAASTIHIGEPKALYTDPRPARLVDVSPDGKHGLVLQVVSRSDVRLLKLSMETGKTQQLYPKDDTQVAIAAAKFGPPKTQRVYVATDGGGEQAVLLALDPASGKVLAKHEITPATAHVSDLAIAKAGGLVAASLVAGSRTELRLLDGRTLAPRAEVQMPLGMGSLGEFSTDGKRLVATWSTPRTPTDVFVIDTATGKASPLREEPRPTLAPVAVDTTVVDIPAFDGGRIPTNVYLPAGGARGTQKRPVLVVYHGGPAGTSLVRWNTAYAFFLSLGYAIVEPNVRGSTGFGRAYEQADNGRKRLDAFKDIETSARWVAAQPWADKDRMVAYGSSYGGYSVLIALTRWPELWRAGVDLYGVANLKTVLATTTGWIREVFKVELGDLEQDADFLASISPIHDADKIVDPTFVYAGANDPRVPRSESDMIVKALRGRRVASEYFVAANEGHSMARKDNQIAFLGRVARFLEQHLR